ncbi:hypothetical protein RRG08_053096 [Elysia crispata]|uniref:Uncharacterized protein n=1 Tax=Elysia crispata TaxID=231223 RepID=A0AAE1CR06_9GAST|nr:hypothetical protein RRG08_053096 [Elysia crispata]
MKYMVPFKGTVKRGRRICETSPINGDSSFGDVRELQGHFMSLDVPRGEWSAKQTRSAQQDFFRGRVGGRLRMYLLIRQNFKLFADTLFNAPKPRQKVERLGESLPLGTVCMNRLKECQLIK